MNRVLRIVMWVVLLAAIFVAIAFFLPGEVNVVRSKNIEAGAKLVFSQINDLHRWNNWSKWNRMDPEMKIVYSNNGVGKNAGYEWSSQDKNVGSGSLKIIESVKYDSIVININFREQGEARSVFRFYNNVDGTKVDWSLKYDLGNNPVSRWVGLLMDKFIGEDFETGLTNLDALCRLLKEKKTYVVELGELESFHFASIRSNVSFNEISLKMGEMYGRIGEFLSTTDAEMSGMPYAVYHLMNGQEIDLECGIPVSKKIEGNNIVVTGTYETTRCAVVDYYGDYHQLELGHVAIQNWIEEHGFNLAGAPLEIYLTDPGLETDPEKWHTRIFYPLE